MADSSSAERKKLAKLKKRDFALFLDVSVDNMVLLSASDVYDKLDADVICRHSGVEPISFSNMYLYFICKRKRFLPEIAKYHKGSKDLFVRVANGEEPIFMTIALAKLQNMVPGKEPILASTIESHPESVFVLYENNQILELDFHRLAFLCNKQIPDIHTLDLLYIGKGQSDTSDWNAFSRLKRHEVLGPITANRRDDERILVFCASLKAGVRCLSGFGSPESLQARNEALQSLKASDVVLTAEALMINYFKTRPWNTKNVDEFLTKEIRGPLIKRGILGVNMHFDTIFSGHQLRTNHRGASLTHPTYNWDLLHLARDGEHHDKR
jgi:hypothetical protein